MCNGYVIQIAKIRSIPRESEFNVVAQSLPELRRSMLVPIFVWTCGAILQIINSISLVSQALQSDKQRNNGGTSNRDVMHDYSFSIGGFKSSWKCKSPRFLNGMIRRNPNQVSALLPSSRSTYYLYWKCLNSMAVHEFWKQLGEKDEFNNRKMRATASRSRVADNAAMSRFKRTGSSLYYWTGGTL